MSSTVTVNNMNGGASMTSQACAACKFQRRKCPVDCPLAPYFPAEANQRFLSCKRLFGVSNMLRFLRDADPADREDTMKSLIYEAEVRDKDPVNGCLGVITRLAEQIRCMQRELELMRSLVHQQQCSSPPSVPSLLQQADLAHPLVGLGGGGNSASLALPLVTSTSGTFRHSGSSLALDDPFDFESQIEQKFLLRS